jgi:alkanesulfonate monooxygenase SsuD/methylene tetrahydromethanopterin reductase-like flavin-dependent oxidoreductase (luciferase family)
VVLDAFRTNLHTIIGTPEEVAEQIRAYGEVGIEEFMVQWGGVADIEGLQVLAEQVAPLLQ